LRLKWLGTEALTWRDLLVIVHQSPRDSAVGSVLAPESRWGLQEQLLAAAVDALMILAWQNTKDAQDGRNMPEPVPRPGVEAPKNETKFGSGRMTPEEVEAWLRARNPLQHGG
jgi:hypothetical protein